MNDLTLPYYNMAKAMFEKAGRTIVNLSKWSALDVFEKQDIGLW